MPEPPDSKPAQALEHLAAAVLAGRAVDWASQATAAPPNQQGVVRQLHALSAIAHFYEHVHLGGAPAATMPIGATWGPLRIDALIGVGAYGEVYRAFDTRLGREVALKLLRVGDRQQDSPASQVVAEASRLARVHHPHVVTIHGAERVDGREGLWMELVAGETLAQYLGRCGPLPAREVVTVGHDLAGALQAVHEAGLVHGDVKAHNVMREPSGRIVLMDFGAGTDVWAGPDAPAQAALTPRYAAPEVRHGSAPTPAADVYSLGILLHLLATGRFPDGRHSSTTHGRSAARPTARLSRLVADALDADPARRPSATALARRLAVRGRWHAPLAGVMVFTLVVAAGVLLTRERPEPSTFGRVEGTLPSVQRVPVPPHLLVGLPARTAPLLAYADTGGHVAVLDLESMTPRRVVMAANGGSAEFTALSPDGSLLAYQWRLPDDTYELRIAPVAGGTPRVLIRAHPLRYPRPLDWSADGQHLLVLSRADDGARVLELVPVRSGTPRLVRRFTSAAPFAATLSPDGRLVAFDDLATDATARDVWVTDVRSGETWPLAAHAASDAFPAWTPDGRGVFFVSHRAGSADGWLQPVRHGRPQGEPFVVMRHLGRVSPLGFGAGGQYYYLAQTSVIDAVTAPIDLRAGRVGAPRRVSTRFEGNSAQPAWSPDGRHLAFIGLQGPIRGDRGGHVLVVRDSATGAERVMAEALTLFLPPLSWSPDGTQVLLRGTDATQQQAHHHVAVGTGIVSPPLADGRPLPSARWAEDGRHVLLLDPRGVVAIDRVTGQEQVRLPRAASGLAHIQRFFVSPDGRAIAVSGSLPDVETTSLRIADAAGRLVELVRSARGERLVAQCWTPDGQQVLFTRWSMEAGAAPHALWMARRDGGAVRSLDFSIAGWTQANGVSMHPDGASIAFTAGDVSWEVSRLVNVLAPRQGAPRF
jgi:Tol biopolymer transport system component